MYAVPTLDIGHLVEFVNEYADRPRATAGELDLAYPSGTELLAWPDSLPWPRAGEPVDAANAAFRVFAAAPNGGALDELNALLQASRPAPVATVDGARWSVETAERLLPAALSTCLLEWLDRHDQARLGICHGAKCVDVYADTSPAGRRRFCSPTCLNRHKVAAFRRRAPRQDGT